MPARFITLHEQSETTPEIFVNVDQIVLVKASAAGTSIRSEECIFYVTESLATVEALINGLP